MPLLHVFHRMFKKRCSFMKAQLRLAAFRNGQFCRILVCSDAFSP